MIGGVYQIRNLQTGDGYIGRAVDFQRRWRNHRLYLRRGGYELPVLQRAWNKYGEKAFIFEPLIECSKPEAIAIEQLFLDGRVGRYNVSRSATSPGGFNDSHSDETRAKIGAANRGKVRSAETRARIGDAHRGKTYSAETKAKISAARTGKPMPAKTKSAIAAFWRGRKHSESTKAKMSAAHVGNSKTEETKAKISLATKKRKRDALGRLFGEAE